MRKVFGFIAALAGGYLVWRGFKIGRVLLVLEDSRFDGTMLTIAGVVAAVGIGLMVLGWRLFSDPLPPQQPPPDPHGPPALPQPPAA